MKRHGTPDSRPSAGEVRRGSSPAGVQALPPPGTSTGPGDHAVGPGASPRRAATLTSQTIAGLRWAAISLVAAVVLQLGYQVVINRLLDPETFGLMAVAVIGLRFAKFLSESGLVQAVVQKPRLDEDDVRIAFTLSMVLGVTVFAAMWVAAPVVASFIDDPRLTPILRVIGAGALVNNVGIVAWALLRRDMRFRSVNLRELFGFALGFPVAGLVLATLGFGVWSLVAAYLVANTVTAAAMYRGRRHSMRPLWRRDRASSLAGYGVRHSGYSLLVFMAANLDTVWVSRYVDSSMVGQYSRAFMLTSLPIAYVTHSVSKVLLPGLSRIQDQDERLQRVYLQGLSTATFLVVPVVVGIAVAAREVVLVVIGPQWDTAITLVPIFALGAALGFLSNLAGTLCDARAKLNGKLGLQVGALGLLLGLLTLASGRGLWAFAAALSATEAVRFAGYVVLTRRVLGTPRGALLRAYLPGVVTAAAVGLLIAATRAAGIALGAPLLVLLSIEVGAGAVGLLLALRLPIARDVRREVTSRLRIAGILDKPGIVGAGARRIVGAPS